MLYSSTNFFWVVVDAFTILSSLCSTGQQLFILICSAVQPTQIIQYVEDASECRLCNRSYVKINKVHIYTLSTTVSGPRRNCNPHPLSLSLLSQRGGDTLSCGWGGGVVPKYIYITRAPQCMAPRRNCNPHPLSLSLLSQRGGTHSPAGEGLGWSQSTYI